MTSYDTYVFILCLIVFVVLTAVFVSTIVMMTKQGLRLISIGAEDKRIYKEYIDRKNNPDDTASGGHSVALTVFFACVIAIIFSFTLVIKLSGDKQTNAIPTCRVVYSQSMSEKYEKNTYLFENHLDDQFSRFDVVITYQLPKEEDLKLYDIVVYEVDDVLLIHRIVGIEEPNEKHPNERHFVLQGDFVDRPDKFPVLYSQMKAIYRGEHIPFVGSFIMFLQSPAGYICLLLVVVEMISSPLIVKKIDEEEQARLLVIKELKKKAREKAKAKKLKEQKKAERERARKENPPTPTRTGAKKKPSSGKVSPTKKPTHKKEKQGKKKSQGKNQPRTA